MRWGAWTLVGTLVTGSGFAAGCGKTTIATLRIFNDGGTQKDSSASDAAFARLPDGEIRDGGIGDSDVSDGNAWPHPLTDARPTVSDSGDDGGPLDCAALRPLAGQTLTSRRPNKVLFSPDGKYIVMIVRAEFQPPGGGTMDDVMLITLPSGATAVLAHRARDVSWLGQTNMLLVRSADDELQIVDLAGRALAVAPNVCDYVATPDGRYVYVIRDCDIRAAGLGKLDVVDIQTSGVTSYGDVLARPDTLSLLPDGRWIAYVAASFPGSTAKPLGNVDLRDRTINHFPIGEPYPGSTAPSFITDRSLLFQVPDPSFSTSNVYRYTFGGTSSYLMATNRHVGFGGYKVSADKQYLLTARWLEPAPNELCAVHLDDATETLVASDLLLYQQNQIGPTAFAFTKDSARVVYLNHQYTGTSTVPVGGGAPTKISGGTGFVVSPYADRVATLDTSSVLEASSVYVSDPASSAPSFGYDANALIRAVTFVPGDRGLVFVESRLDGEHLRHLSFRDGAPTDLARWTASSLPLTQFPLGEMKPVYPVDPTGCYVVIDQDQDAAGATGTSIALVPD